MIKHVILHDRRLLGAAPVGKGLTTIRLDGSTSLFASFPLITTLRQLDGAQNLFILCHGYAGINQRGQVCGDMGGMGLELGREGVLHSNVARWSALRGALSTIVVYSCGAADTQLENRGTAADGRYLMGALAIHTSATVYAADRIQWYTMRGGANGTIDFGRWEGTLWRFEPNGSFAPAAGNRVPLELTEA
jgi:hypothetical protein